MLSPLKKGAGAELTGESPAKKDGREVPVPLFQQPVSRLESDVTGTATRFCLLVVWGWAACAGAAPAARPLYILQANDLDPTAPSSQPAGRWYHWLGCDPAVTHLETGLAIDSAAMAGRGQRIELAVAAPVAAIQVKLKRIGRPGALCWEAGTARGRADLGRGQIPPERVAIHYERFLTLAIQPARTPVIFLRIRAA